MKTICNLILVLIALLVGCTQKKEVVYHDNGNLKFEASLLLNMRHGESIEYFENGLIKNKGNWVFGVRNGISNEYHHNGKIKWKGNYSDGMADGKFNYYDSGGMLEKSVFYNEDLKDGPLTKYYHDGSIKSEYWYKDDELHGEGYFYFPNGRIFYEMLFDNGEMWINKKYDSLGNYLGKILPIATRKIDGRTVEFKLLYSEYDSVDVGILLAKFDKHGDIIVTLDRKRYKGLSFSYEFPHGQNVISGIFYEIIPQDQIAGETYFTFEIDKLELGIWE